MGYDREAIGSIVTVCNRHNIRSPCIRATRTRMRSKKITTMLYAPTTCDMDYKTGNGKPLGIRMSKKKLSFNLVALHVTNFVDHFLFFFFFVFFAKMYLNIFLNNKQDLNQGRR